MPGRSGTVYAPPSRNYMVVTAETLNMRRCPDTTCQLMALLFRGETVAVRQQGGAWTEIETRRGVVGWVAARYLGIYRPGDDPAALGAPPPLPDEELADPATPGPPEITEELADPVMPPGQANQPPEVYEEFGR